MKRRIFIVAIVVAGLLATPKLFTQNANADESAQQLVASCQRAQNYLEKIQKPRDLRGRVDRLQAYRYIYQRLNVFVIRLEKNDQFNADVLRATLDTLNEQIDTFKDDYEVYDSARDAVSDIDNCQKNNKKFTELLTDARQKRQVVHDDIVALDATLSPKATNQLEQLYQHFLIGGSSGGSTSE